jgi:glycosyltransferase involved in cell wall biosynthesis
MKVAINITREPLAGITSTNLSLLNHLHESNTSFAGIELNAYRMFKSALVYRHLSTQWFNHHIVSICDFVLNAILKRSSSLQDVEIKFKPIVDVVRNILKKEKPDVLLINGTYYVPWILSIAAQKEGIPIVLWYAGVLTKEVEHMTPKFRRILHAMERSIVRRARRVIFPSALCKQIVCDEIVCTDAVRKGIVVPNPISPIFTHGSNGGHPVERCIAFVGRNTPIKNIEAFCSLHKKLLRKGWKHEATIVSDISEKDQKKLPKSVKVLPSMSAAELKVFYMTQGLIISPSHFETFGNVPIEAACIGIPVLVSKTMGCSEVFAACGLERMVADFNDEDAVIERVKELCGQHILPRQLNNLRKRVDTKYVANKIHSVIKS